MDSGRGCAVRIDMHMPIPMVVTGTGVGGLMCVPSAAGYPTIDTVGNPCPFHTTLISSGS